MVKRVAAIPGDPQPNWCMPVTTGPAGDLVPPGRFLILGDNPAWSQDSRQIGYIPGERLLGIVMWLPSVSRGLPERGSRLGCGGSGK
jgi:signal peptidase I